MSRSALVARTGLTRSAIRGLIGELVAGGLVSEGRAARLGTPGRPSPLVYPEPDGAVVLALDIEVDSLAAALVGLGSLAVVLGVAGACGGSPSKRAQPLGSTLSARARPTR